jgi:ABC-type Fe3+ transport system permease subunit
MKAIDYLYYKFYKVSKITSVSDIPHYTAAMFSSGILAINIITINAYLRKMEVTSFFFKSKDHREILLLIFFCLLLILLRRKHNKEVVAKYSLESEKERIKGSRYVGLYILLSFLCFFFVIFFRPGIEL